MIRWYATADNEQAFKRRPAEIKGDVRFQAMGIRIRYVVKKTRKFQGHINKHLDSKCSTNIFQFAKL